MLSLNPQPLNLECHISSTPLSLDRISRHLTSSYIQDALLKSHSQTSGLTTKQCPMTLRSGLTSAAEDGVLMSSLGKKRRVLLCGSSSGNSSHEPEMDTRHGFSGSGTCCRVQGRCTFKERVIGSVDPNVIDPGNIRLLHPREHVSGHGHSYME